MRAVDAQRIERVAGFCAAASLAAAVGFAVFHAVGLVAGVAAMVAAGGLSALAAYPAGTTLIRMLEGAPKPLELVPFGHVSAFYVAPLPCGGTLHLWF